MYQTYRIVLCVVFALITATLSLAAPPSPQATPSLSPVATDPPPEVYNTPHLQAPVHMDPGDALLIPGDGFQYGASVVYLYAPDPASPPAPVVPSEPNTELAGWLDLPLSPEGQPDAYADLPHSLIARVPPQVESGRPYVLYVLNADGQWSDPIPVNHARPLWVTPDLAYATAKVAGLSRSIKIVGRNLRPDGRRSRVRLVGPKQTYTRRASGSTSPTGDYVLEVRLPRKMKPGLYSVWVKSWGVWHLASANKLEVKPDPAAKPEVEVGASGLCLPDDGVDDTMCIAQAIATAANMGGAVVFFGPGQWDLIETAKANTGAPSWWTPRYGIVVPPGVDLVGAPGEMPVLAIGPAWDGGSAGGSPSVFTLLGHNEVRGLHGTEIVKTGVPPKEGLAFFRIGGASRTSLVERITIRDSVLDEMYTGIGSRAAPMRRVYVHENRIRGYYRGLSLIGQSQYSLDVHFTIRDSIFINNLFLPGDYRDTIIRQGTIATDLGAGERVDFSDNIADGTVHGGWRAAHFWYNAGNQEMVLVSGNRATCTGDKGGDGEFIVFDIHDFVTGFEAKTPVLRSDHDFVEVKATWRKSTPDFYNGMWVSVVRGPGAGQSRKIVSYTTGAHPVIHVSPSWDVIPEPDASEIVVTRSAWSTYVVDNEVDNSKAAGCLGNDLLKEGTIGNLNFTTDSTIDGNVLYRSGGIHISKGYGTPAGYNSRSYALSIFASEIRRNLLAGKPEGEGNAKGGIDFVYGTNQKLGPSILHTHNLVVAQNEIVAAEGNFGGAISTWIGDHNALETCSLSTILIFGNFIQDVKEGILIDGKRGFPGTCRTVLWDNEFVGVPVGKEVVDLGTETVFLPASQDGRD